MMPGPRASRLRVHIDLADPQLELVRARMGAAGWELTDGRDWDLRWSLDDAAAAVLAHLEPGQRVNHLAGIACLAHKDQLWLTVERHRRLLARRGLYTELVVPPTWLMPDDRAAFLATAACEPEAVWIQKPKAGARGEGVSLLSDALTAEPGANWLVQRYIDRPHLLDGFKYTLRCYVLISSLEPLAAYVFRDGFVKLTSHPFLGARRDDRLARLTNPDVQAANPELAVSARNLTHAAYAARLRSDGVDANLVFSQVYDLLRFAVAAARESLLKAAWSLTSSPETGFELLGCDVALDETLRPWLLEANMSPSLKVEATDSRATAEEAEVKARLLDAVLDLVDGNPVQSSVAAAPSGFAPLFPAFDYSLMTLRRPTERPDRPALRVGLLGSFHRWPVGDGLLVHSDAEADVQLLDPTAAYIWSAIEDGMALGEITAEFAEAVPELASRAGADVFNAVAGWVQEGFVTEIEAPTSPTAKDPFATLEPGGSDSSAVSHPVRLVGWNPEAVYTYIGVPVAVRSPSAEVAAWVATAMPALLDVNRLDAAGEVKIDAESRGWYVRYEGGLVACASPHQVAGAVRAAVIEIASKLSRSLGLHATLLGVASNGPILVMGPADARLRLIDSWLASGRQCLADDLVTLADASVERAGSQPCWIGHRVGIDTAGDGEQYGKLAGWLDANPLIVSPFGRFLHHHLRDVAAGPTPAPSRIVTLSAVVATPGPMVAVPASAMDAAADLLASRPTHGRRIDARQAAALVELASSVPAYRAAPGDETASREVLLAL